MMPNQLIKITLVLLFIIFPISHGKCKPSSRIFRNKCFAVLKKTHIAKLRSPLSRAVDVDKKGFIPDLTTAEEMCRRISEATSTPEIKMTDQEKEESTGFVNLGNKLVVARIDDQETLDWLIIGGFAFANSRKGGRAFVKISSSLKTDRNLNKYNEGEDAVLQFDPGNLNQSGLYKVNGQDPYHKNAPEDVKIKHVICEYQAMQDCKWVPAYEDKKCKLIFVGTVEQCSILDHWKKQEGDREGAQCPKKENKTTKCPDTRDRECNGDCVWGEWGKGSQCDPKKRVNRRVYFRPKKIQEYGQLDHDNCTKTLDMKVEPCAGNMKEGSKVVIVGVILLVYLGDL